MFEIIKLLFDICLFKKGPQDLPNSVWLLRILVVVDGGISFLMMKIRTDWLNSLLQAAAGVLLVIGFSWIMMYVARRPARFNLTACSLLGTDALISFFAFPGIASMVLDRGALLAFFVMIGLMIWHWAVTGHIIRNALEQTLVFSLGLAFLYMLGSYQVMALLFPDIAGAN